MALAAQLRAAEPKRAAPSWNPLHCGGTALPVNLLLAVKLIALTLLLTNHVLLLQAPFVPFVSALDHIPGLLFRVTVSLVFVLSALALLFNRYVRISCLALGTTILLCVVASRIYYGNNKLLCGCIFFLTGLYKPGQQPWLLRYQLVIVYLGAGLNKLLDVDWRSGVFFENWAVRALRQPVYIAINAWLPPMWLARVMSWMTILTELGLSVAFQVRSLYPWGIYANLLLHSGILFFTGSTFTMFFYAMSASMLVFVEWPRSPLVVIYDRDCGFCNRLRGWMESFDLEGMLDWIPYQNGSAEQYGVGPVKEGCVYVANGQRIYSGYAAIKMMLLYNPVTYFVMTALIAAQHSAVSTGRVITVAILLAIFLPPFEPVGQAVYHLLTRDLRRLQARLRP